jgi:hypothetical protein
VIFDESRSAREVVHAVDVAGQLHSLHGVNPAMIVVKFIEDHPSRDGYRQDEP